MGGKSAAHPSDKGVKDIVSLIEGYGAGSRRDPFPGARCSSGTFLADELTSH